MKKADIEFMAMFKPGQTVKILEATYHKDTIGKTAKVVRVIKTKMELEVYILDGFVPYSELIRQQMDPQYVPLKHYTYYPNAKNVEIIDD